ncbi:LSU ribosomal protein L15P [Chitinophaga skermanii]|uniref:Large ribosomal subunit protein uL15 n=1 Tax=Chitinophaga skermanii TaxID=331697 RepID=A0A327Q5T2_9BACT|nr:50S ribosomal protein L15 [Chitinophaga skermanii]RAI99789.1 LSU ribosomal protein L15P [Chitinophaga skermanii]
MNLHTLRPAKGAVHKEKRLGRGEASGKGGTSTKGNKGAQSNTGYSSKIGHEGGQMPIQRRLPKRGFINNNRVEYKVFNVGFIDQIVEKYGLQEISLETLYMNGLINKTAKVKILGQGELKSKVALKVNAISEKAKQVVEAAGGSVELV